MTDFQKMEQLAKADCGVLKTSSVTAMGISKTALAQFISKNEYERVSLGVYLAPDAWRDDAYLLQLRCPQVVFSHDSALFYHDLTDREPLQLTVTAKTSFGHLVNVYDMERTICDILRSRNSMETQVFQDALKMYSKRRDKDLQNLMDYAKLFHVEKLMRQYMGVLL